MSKNQRSLTDILDQISIGDVSGKHLFKTSRLACANLLVEAKRILFSPFRSLSAPLSLLNFIMADPICSSSKAEGK